MSRPLRASVSKPAAPSRPATPAPASSEKPASLLSTIKDPAGGITRVPSLEEVLDEMNRKDDWEKRPDHYYFSGLFRCFRADWYEAKGKPCDHGVQVKKCPTCRFDSGKAQPGNATENHVRKLYAEILNFGKPDGPILNDIRFSIPIPVEWSYEEESQKTPGKFVVKTKRDTVHLVGKTDTLFLGDNMKVLQFSEIKSPIFTFPAKARRLTEKFGTKRIPLSMAGITEPEDPEGIVALNHVAQLAVGCKVLEDKGQAPEEAVLLTVDRGNYRDHVEVIVTAEEWRFLYDLAVWWVKEHHANLQFDEPPAPEFFMGWACRYCPFDARCAADNKRLGQERVIHPVVPGISARLSALNDSGPSGGSALPKRVQASLHVIEAAKARETAKEAKRTMNQAIHAAKQSGKKAASARATAQHEEARGKTEPQDPVAFLVSKLGRRATEAELKEEFDKFIEYGVSPENAVKTILRHHGVPYTPKGGHKA